MPMVTFMKVIGKTIKLTEKENIFIWTEPNTKENGLKINNTVTEKKDGPI